MQIGPPRFKTSAVITAETPCTRGLYSGVVARTMPSSQSVIQESGQSGTRRSRRTRTNYFPETPFFSPLGRFRIGRMGD